ncbi:methyltransferase domain-containing protein [Candidatus Woesearchaeota archaeon]|nr:methyltransferase domain-containing protein [Candidatus Woesearchaeota archaeon]
MATVNEIREAQRKSWDAFAHGWKKHDTFMMHKLKPVGDALLEAAKLQDGYNVLDVATGTGEPGITAAALVGKGAVIGTDLSQEMVAIALEHARRKGVMNYTAEVADATKLPFADAAFDAVICRFGVMFFPDPAAAVQEMVRVAKPGRAVALSAWALPQKNPWVTVIGGIVNKALNIEPPAADAPQVFRFADSGKLAGLLKGAGLKQVSLTEQEGITAFGSPEQYWEIMTEIAAPIAMALRSAYEDKVAEIREAVIRAAQQYAKNGRLEFPYSAWIVSGIK